MKKSKLVTGVILLSLVFLVLMETRKLPIGNLSVPQAGFFPLVLGILLGVFSVIYLIQGIKEKEPKGVSFWGGPDGLKKISLILGPLFAISIFFETIGYLVSTFFFMAFVLATIGRKKWWVVITTAFLTSLISYLLFDVALKTRLPIGILGRLFS